MSLLLTINTDLAVTVMDGFKITVKYCSTELLTEEDEST
jgi:hypothetical protein